MAGQYRVEQFGTADADYGSSDHYGAIGGAERVEVNKYRQQAGVKDDGFDIRQRQSQARGKATQIVPSRVWRGRVYLGSPGL